MTDMILSIMTSIINLYIYTIDMIYIADSHNIMFTMKKASQRPVCPILPGEDRDSLRSGGPGLQPGAPSREEAQGLFGPERGRGDGWQRELGSAAWPLSKPLSILKPFCWKMFEANRVLLHRRSIASRSPFLLSKGTVSEVRAGHASSRAPRGEGGYDAACGQLCGAWEATDDVPRST